MESYERKRADQINFIEHCWNENHRKPIDRDKLEICEAYYSGDVLYGAMFRIKGVGTFIVDEYPLRRADRPYYLTGQEQDMVLNEYINGLKMFWVGKKVRYDGEIYTVKDVDCNGFLLIDKPGEFTDTTAVVTYMVERLNT